VRRNHRRGAAPPHLPGQRAAGPIQPGQHLADRRPQLGDGVLGGHRVQHRRRVQHPRPALHRTRRPGHHLGVLKQPPRPGRGPQPIAHPHQHRRVKRPAPGICPGRRLPAQVELQPVTGLPVAEPLKGLQQHDGGHHPGRHRRPALHRPGVQVREVAIGEHHLAVIGQQPVKGTLPKPLTQQLPRIVKTLLNLCPAQRHRTIFPGQRILRSRDTQPARARTTRLLQHRPSTASNPGGPSPASSARAARWPMAGSIGDDEQAGMVPLSDLAGVGTAMITTRAVPALLPSHHRRVAGSRVNP
jgi:hypothetical protein